MYPTAYPFGRLEVAVIPDRILRLIGDTPFKPIKNIERNGYKFYALEKRIDGPVK